MSKSYKCHGICFKRIKNPKYKYELLKNYRVFVNIAGSINTKYLKLKNGWLTLSKGYRWDGCSGPSWDGFILGKLVNSCSMRGGLVHDGLYQLFRMKKLSRKLRKFADKLFYKILRADGMTLIRAKVYYYSVRGFAGYAAK